MYQNREFKHRTFRESFVNARKGLSYAFKHERNMRRMAVLGAASIVAGIVLSLTRIEWLILIVTIGIVLSAELMNTLVEYLCDLFRPKYDLRIKVLKDLASAAPLLASIISLIVATLLFYPHVCSRFFR